LPPTATKKIQQLNLFVNFSDNILDGVKDEEEEEGAKEEETDKKKTQEERIDETVAKCETLSSFIIA
jgi:hypothetical protein